MKKPYSLGWDFETVAAPADVVLSDEYGVGLDSPFLGSSGPRGGYMRIILNTGSMW